MDASTFKLLAAGLANSKITPLMFIGLAIVESLAIYALVIAFIILFSF